MSTIDERIAMYAATLEAANTELTTLETTWNNGSPEKHSCEMRAALWKRIVEVQEIVYEQIKNQILTEMQVSEGNWYLYEYDSVENVVRYKG